MKKRRAAGVLAGIAAAGLFAAGMGMVRVSAGETIGANINQTETLKTEQEETVLPAYWSAVEAGRKPTVRNQDSVAGPCWALAAVEALETSLLPQQRIVFSADHMTLNNSFTLEVEDGGDLRMAMAYFSGWQGPVLEFEDPFGDSYSPEGLTPAVHVQEMQILSGAGTEELKEAVYTYGAVQSSLFMRRRDSEAGPGYFNEETYGYYCPEETTQNHEILILGWDDSYSRLNFLNTPQQDGAFICQNSWGSDFGEDGIFYVSYEDANIGVAAIAYTKIEEADNYDHLYQTDDCGWRGRQGYDSGECWFANVYTAESGETLEAVGFYALGEDTSYEIYLSKGSQWPESFETRTLLQSGSVERAGYYTISLVEGIPLEAGEDFAVIVKINVPSGENPVAVEYRSEAAGNVTTEGKRGYISRTGEDWDHTESIFGSNVCLKAYTKDAAEGF